MTFTPFEETQLVPLTTDDQIERRVADLVGRANTRQLWLLFLDEADVQLPLLIPIEGLPLEPTHDEAERVVDRIRSLMGEIGATAVITVIERYAASALTSMDSAWARSLRESCESHGVTLRAQLLSHRGGVRLLADDETVLH
jgi:sugar phosphate isomerase/epimerase